MTQTTPEMEFELPGFRFHPTEEELLDFYLKNTVYGKSSRYDVIGLLNIYNHDPWDLPGLAKHGEREWYFLVPRDRRHGNGGRPNRTTRHGFWKATGSDRKILSMSDPKRLIGLRKTLVFYEGRAPRGSRTDWVMNEYRLPAATAPLPKDIVLCKIYRKATSLKDLEEKMKTAYPAVSSVSTPSMTETCSAPSQEEDLAAATLTPLNGALKKEYLEPEMAPEEDGKAHGQTRRLSIQLPGGKNGIPDLLVPMLNDDWTQPDSTQDPFSIPFFSPYFQNLMAYGTLLNF